MEYRGIHRAWPLFTRIRFAWTMWKINAMTAKQAYQTFIAF